MKHKKLLLWLSSLGMFGNGWQNFSVPDNFTLTLPFTIQQNGRQFRAWDTARNKVFDVADLAPTGAKIYYVDIATGNDGFTGLSWAQAFKSIKTAVAKSDVNIVYVKAGVYPYGNGWDAAANLRGFSVYAVGGTVISSGHDAALVWTPDGANPGAYKATVTNAIRTVYDASNLDANDDYTVLTSRATAALVAANANSWYTNGTDIWVRLFDDRAPDSNLRPYVNLNPAGRNRRGFTVYVEGIEFHGGSSAGFAATCDAGYNRTTLYMKNCKFKYVGQNGLDSDGVYSILQNCTASKCGMDGLNYHRGTGNAVYPPWVIEIDCVGRYCGSNITGTDNGSTIHDGGQVLRMMGDYHHNTNRNIHDIQGLAAGTKSLNLGCKAHDSTGPVNNCNVTAGQEGSDNTEMWLDCFESYGSTTDLEEDTNSILHYRNLVSNGVFIGTPVPY